MNEQSILQIRHLSFRYDDEYVLQDINLSIPKGAFVGLVGPNGSGKSTLLKCILRLLKPQEGEIFLFETPIAQFKEWHKIGFVSQKANSFNTGFPATVYEVVASGLTGKIGLFRSLKKKDKEAVFEAIEAVGMSDFVHRNIGELSGGQQQRVFIARAIVSQPEFLILDEPTVGVDVHHVQNFYNMLERLNKQLNITLLLVTHDIGTITEKVTHVACLNKHLHFHGSVSEFAKLKTEDLSMFYGHHLHLLTHDHA
ncbi:zinc transport system ATP-binding protein [Thermolongibacillus altinsuensis]|jgi:zinc transport system ATP-binding protein|uniref:Zinc transport system ATP-binding protein n=1 Tax=Thermolongibacillus altinsuensis TaxID=575256 RepID=A0A4R1QCZ2_9BACL|nr:metal ABC transporter ATP-binding protein [Thermolongibacillus altinsuensis]TCL48838.1 zinc transport system ATP-binding protein [Thermolongibacillus altinsuensis]GMB07604.1 zinc ABC transporter ATP-binding protein [Thermolongibacillus altinsuensis]